MTHGLMLHAFGLHCDLSRTPDDSAGSRTRSILSACFLLATWERILTELVDRGLLEALEECHLLEDFRAVMSNLVIDHPANFLLSAGDWAVVESFDAPACPAVGARGEPPARPATPAVMGPPRLRFWESANFPNLLAPPPSPAFSFVSYLAGMLGPCLDRFSRADTGSTVYTWWAR